MHLAVRPSLCFSGDRERERERAVRAGGERQSDALMDSTLNAFFCMLEMLKCCRTGVRGQMSVIRETLLSASVVFFLLFKSNRFHGTSLIQMMNPNGVI